MSTTSSTPRRLRQAAAIILAVGLAAAALVYARAGTPDDASGGYAIVGGQAFAVEESPAQRAQTERMGGRALVVTTQFNHWLGSLWHGERLAWTLAALSAFASLLCLYIAGVLAEDMGEEPPHR